MNDNGLSLTGVQSMKGRALTGILLVLGFGLGMILVVGDSTVSKVMERCGEFISNGLGL